jgi:hypothetical protein
MFDVVHVLVVITMPRFFVLVDLLLFGSHNLRASAGSDTDTETSPHKPSGSHQPWELEQLNVVQWQFLDQQKLIARFSWSQ